MTRNELTVLINQLYQKKQYREGQLIMEKLLLNLRDDPFLWEGLGMFLNAQDHPLAAIAAYRRVLESKPSEKMRPYSNMGNAYQKAGLTEEALYYHELASKQYPNDSLVLMNYGIALKESAQRRKAFKIFSQSFALNPENYISAFNVAILHLFFGEYEKGWELFESRFMAYPNKFMNTPNVGLWTGEHLQGKTLLLLSEQGFGDTLLMSRFIPFLKKNPEDKIVLLVPSELTRLFQDIEGVDLLLPSPISATKLPPIDVYLYLMSLPNRLQINKPSLVPPPIHFHIPEEAKTKMQNYLKPFENRFKVGIAWTGRKTNEVNTLRSIPLEKWIQFLEIPNVELFGFQKGEAETDITRLGLTAFVHNVGAVVSDFADTAAALQMMDLVITIDSSIGHLAGTLGVPTWILLHKAHYWLWLEDKKDSVWYPSAKLYHQKDAHNWDSVFKDVHKDLHALVTKTKETVRFPKASEI